MDFPGSETPDNASGGALARGIMARGTKAHPVTCGRQGLQTGHRQPCEKLSADAPGLGSLGVHATDFPTGMPARRREGAR